MNACFSFDPGRDGLSREVRVGETQSPRREYPRATRAHLRLVRILYLRAIRSLIVFTREGELIVTVLER